jgi:redox-sensing transcriptional repressor
MSDRTNAPQASVLRLSRYHCLIGELLRDEEAGRITSRFMAEQLGVAEETVRRDLSYVEAEGRPGAGYDPSTLYDSLEAYLGLTADYPFVAIGSAAMLDALAVIFPAEEFGLHMVAAFSEREEDAGTLVRGIQVRPLAELAAAVLPVPVSVVLVACEPSAVPGALEAAHAAGIDAALMLTPVLRPRHPEGMQVTYFRIPCSLKSLASAAAMARTSSCCGNTARAAGGSAGAPRRQAEPPATLA